MKNPSRAKADNNIVIQIRRFGWWPFLIGIPPGVLLFLFSPVVFLMPLVLGFLFLLLVHQSDVQSVILKAMLVIGVHLCSFVLAILVSLALCKSGMVNCVEPLGILAIHGAWFGLTLLYDLGMVIWSAIMKVSK